MFACNPYCILFLRNLIIITPLKRVSFFRIAILRTPATLCRLVYIRRGRNHDWMTKQQVTEGRDSACCYSVINPFRVIYLKHCVYLWLTLRYWLCATAEYEEEACGPFVQRSWRYIILLFVCLGHFPTFMLWTQYNLLFRNDSLFSVQYKVIFVAPIAAFLLPHSDISICRQSPTCRWKKKTLCCSSAKLQNKAKFLQHWNF